ncbi:MAG: hypothetical protein IKB92_00520 [Clostridia bacterium]|nr:hypothetical protein [Clostridia bacterium]
MIEKASVRSATSTIPIVVGSTRTRPAVMMPKIRLITDRIESALRSSAMATGMHSRFKYRASARISVRINMRILVTFI